MEVSFELALAEENQYELESVGGTCLKLFQSFLGVLGASNLDGPIPVTLDQVEVVCVIQSHAQHYPVSSLLSLLG